jgi:signal transduction histidine kinase
MERSAVGEDGRRYWFHLYTFPLKDKLGNTRRVVEYVKDMTQEKMLQEQILQNERLAIVGRMAMTVAHEVRNPLSTILLNIELLEDEVLKDGSTEAGELREIISTVKAEVDRLTRVTEEYLQFAKVPRVLKELGSLNEVITDLTVFLKEEFIKHDIVLATHLDPTLGDLPIDPKQLRQAFLNILRNSIDALPEGGKIRVETRKNGTHVEVVLSDDGVGIREEHLEEIFTPFFSTREGGTGLGLSITHHIISEHHGSITCESEPGKGASFRITLPLTGSPSQHEGGDTEGVL